MHLLYVEDNPLDADMLTRELARQAPQINVEHAATFAQAAARLETCTPEQPVYDLILTDMHLPDESGLALLPLLQQCGLNLAVVVLTGQGNDEAVVTALKAGADDYVVKRGDYLARLPAILEAALQRHQVETARRARPLRVVYAEDHAIDIDLTQRHFARFAPHIQLEVLRRATDVLQQFPDPGAQPPAACDVLLLDYHLAGMNGLDLMKELRLIRKLDLPIVFVTGQGDEDIALQALRLGAMDYVVKREGYLYKLPVVLENAYHQAQLAREQVEIRQLYATVKQTSAELRALSARLVETEEAERRRLARELHDQVGQNLTALGINLNIFRLQLPAEAQPAVKARLDDTLALVEQTTAWIRDIMADLRPPVLDDYGLLAALRWSGARFAQRTGLTVDVAGDEAAPRLAPDVESALFRIAQEALNNVAKHARASRVCLTLTTEPEKVCLTIADNGIGFAPDDPPAADAAPRWGLISMRERAEAIGGQWRIFSAPGEGTRVQVEIKYLLNPTPHPLPTTRGGG